LYAEPVRLAEIASPPPSEIDDCAKLLFLFSGMIGMKYYTDGY